MTAIGKIFVILNLLFSLVVAGFIVVVYAARTNWADAAKQWKAAQEVANASRQATMDELAQAQRTAADQINKLNQEIASRDQKIQAAKADLENQAKELEAIKKGGNKEGASFLALQTELKKQKDEVTGLEKQVKEKDDQIVTLTTAKNDANNAKVAAEIKANSYQGKAERLEARVREAETEIVKLRRVGGGGAGGIALVSTANPPPQNVEGIVTETTPRGDLMKISIGSDAGLARGHTLDVFRLKPTPQYLGQIRLTDVRAAEAVGVPVDKLKYPVQKGDFVANDVTPRK
jgi:hypothetical protein